MSASNKSVKDRLREYFLANIGVVVNSQQLQAIAAPATEWARRVRELRVEEGWPIFTDKDLDELKPGEYLMKSAPPKEKDVRFSRNMSQKLRAEVLDRNGFTCQMCGICPPDVDPMTGRPVRLHVGHIVDKSLGGEDALANLRTLCSTCNQGAKNITSERPSGIWLLAQVRRSGNAEQRAVYEWLKGKFDGTP